MKGKSFSLQSFPSDDLLPCLEIKGCIGRNSGTFAIGYELIGPLMELDIPEPSDMPSRKNSLWEGTCFEFFLATADSDRYWEFNLCPDGSWNVYLFGSYRQGMREEPAFASLPLIVRSEPGALQISLSLDLSGIIAADQTVKVAVSAIIKSKERRTTYWALIHPGPKPDFHGRDSFILEL